MDFWLHVSQANKSWMSLTPARLSLFPPSITCGSGVGKVERSGKTLDKSNWWNWFLGLYMKMSLFSHQVVSDSLQPHGRQHARSPCPSPSSWSLPQVMPIELVMPSNHLILCCPLPIVSIGRYYDINKHILWVFLDRTWLVQSEILDQVILRKAFQNRLEIYLSFLPK